MAFSALRLRECMVGKEFASVHEKLDYVFEHLFHEDGTPKAAAPVVEEPDSATDTGLHSVVDDLNKDVK